MKKIFALICAVVALGVTAGTASAGPIPPGGVPCPTSVSVCVFVVNGPGVIDPRYRCLRVPSLNTWTCQRFGAVFNP